MVMANPVNVWRIANTYIKDFGDGAELETAMFADSPLEAGDAITHTRTVYCRVVTAIKELQRFVPAESERLN